MVTYKRKLILSRLFTTAAVLFTALVVLGFLRLQASRLEQFLHNIDRNIERYSEEEVGLEQQFSILASPKRIYDDCKKRLGMEQVQHSETIQVPDVHVVAVPSPESQKKWRSNVFSLLGFAVN
jgi:cell division protein FtsL